MTTSTLALPTAEVLSGVERLLDRDAGDRSGLAPDERLRLVRSARRLAERLTATADRLLAEADASDAAMRAAGTLLASWLAAAEAVARRTASGALHRAREFVARPQGADAAAAGRVGLGHARAICDPQRRPVRHQRQRTTASGTDPPAAA